MTDRRAGALPCGPRRKLLLGIAIAAPLLWGGFAVGRTPEGRFMVSYVEAPPDDAAALDRSIQAYAEQMRRVVPSPTVEVLREIGRPNRLVILERWPGSVMDPDPGAGALQQAIEGHVEAPLDRRLGEPLGPLLTSSAKAPFHVVIHIDVVPEGSVQGAEALRDQRAMVLAAPGALGFEVGTQADKPNHFAVHEAWTTLAAYQAYMAGPGGRDLRKRVAQFRGSPVDDRFYRSQPAR